MAEPNTAAAPAPAQSNEDLLESLLANPEGLPKTEGELFKQITTPGDLPNAAKEPVEQAPNKEPAAKAEPEPNAGPKRGPVPQLRQAEELPPIDLAQVPEPLRKAVQAHIDRLRDAEVLSKRSQTQAAKLQHDLSEANKRLAQLQRGGGTAAPGAGGQAGAKPAPLPNLAEKLNSPQFKELEQDYPVVASLREAIGLLAQQNQELSKRLEAASKPTGPIADEDARRELGAIREHVTEVDRQAKLERLLTKHPNAMDTLSFDRETGKPDFMSPEFAQFWWTIPQQLRDSVDPTSLEDITVLLDDFEQWRNPTAAAPNGAAQTPVANQQVDPVKQARREALSLGVAPRLRGPAAGKPSSLEGLSEGQMLKQLSNLTPEQALELLTKN